MLWQEIRDLDVSRGKLRSFGYLVGTVLIGIALFVLWRRDWEPGTLVYVLGGTGLALVGLGLVAPVVLRPIYRVWMAFAIVMGFIMTRVILTLFYFLLVTPIGLILRAVGKDPLNREIDPEASSYWIRKEYHDSSPARLKKYY